MLRDMSKTYLFLSSARLFNRRVPASYAQP